MSLKRAPDDVVAESRPVQRPRLLEGNIQTAPLSLDDINDNCILEIFKCLSVENLNSIAVFISRRNRDLRNHNSLDQTRTGTIVCTENTTVESIRDAFVTQEWNQVFRGNRTRLKIVGLERMPRIRPSRSIFELRGGQDRLLLTNVSSLDTSFDSLTINQIVPGYSTVLFFVSMLSNVREIDLSHMKFGTPRYKSLVESIVQRCRSLQKVISNGSQRRMMMEGSLSYPGFMPHVTELHLDDSLLYSMFGAATTQRAFSDPGNPNCILSRFNNIVSLSIKNLAWCEWREVDAPAQPVTQEMLIKIVRRHPTLRWLRSDLTEANIAMLQQERPEITFVSD
jgi:hypothetical protein